MKVTILRGGTGCGKSTWAKEQNAVIISADDFFIVDGEYKFDVEKLGAAHAACLRDFIHLCEVPLHDKDEGGKDVIVDNTNTRLSEFAPYAAIALAYSHEVKIVTFVYDPVAAWRRSTHGAPFDVAMRQHLHLMRDSEIIPPWWKHEFVPVPHLTHHY